MNYLLSNGSLRVLESLSFTDTLYAFDFDGTLAPIVRNPEDARMSPQVESLFAKFSQRVPTAIISGRSLDDLRKRVPPGPSVLIGNHGIEGLSSRGEGPGGTEECARWRKSLKESLIPEADDPGLELEDKGLSLALHYRKSRKKKLTRNLIMKTIADLKPAPRVVPGKLVVNLVPQGSPHKGLALKALLEEKQARFGFYIGDDMTDEDVFSLGDPKILTVRVGQRMCSEAKYFIKRQGEIIRLLSLLLKFHGIRT